MSMNIKKYAVSRKISISFVFLLMSWGLLYLWLVLMHNEEEQVASTILSSPLIYGCISMSVLLLISQKKSGALKELCILTFGLVVIFAYLILIFTTLLNVPPDIDDLAFYYECFLLIFFIGSPLYLTMRMI